MDGLLAGEIGHSAPGRLEAQHQAALEMVLGTPDLCSGSEPVLEVPEFPKR